MIKYDDSKSIYCSVQIVYSPLFHEVGYRSYIVSRVGRQFLLVLGLYYMCIKTVNKSHLLVLLNWNPNFDMT